MASTFVPTPGEELWADWLEPLNLTVGRAATALGVGRKTLSQIINGHRRITPETSVRLGKALGMRPEAWAVKQLAFDMRQVDARQIKVRRLVPRNAGGE